MTYKECIKECGNEIAAALSEEEFNQFFGCGIGTAADENYYTLFMQPYAGCRPNKRKRRYYEELRRMEEGF